jgi:hypothetical protein
MTDWHTPDLLDPPGWAWYDAIQYIGILLPYIESDDEDK